jgi:hypothetical protein
MTVLDRPALKNGLHGGILHPLRDMAPHLDFRWYLQNSI